MNLLKNKKMFSGGALILQMFLAVCFMVWLFPVNAFAAETLTWTEILQVIGAGTEDKVRENWNYDHDTETLSINPETVVKGSDIVTYKINNYGTILEGKFQGTVINNGTISGGEFSRLVENHCIIEGNGLFTFHINNEIEGTIKDGTFDCTIWNLGTIESGTFTKQIQINGGTISGGTFTSTAQFENAGTIRGGAFDSTITNCKVTWGDGRTTVGIIENGIFNGFVDNKAEGTITGGRFKGELTNTGTITGGKFGCPNPNTGNITGGEFNYVDSESEVQPNPTPENNTSNSKDNADNDNEYVFVEPVVIVVPEGQKYVDDVMEQLSAVPTDGKVVIDTKDWYCFNRTMAEKVTNMKDVTVTIKYKYQGKRYEVTIPAGSDVVSLLGETGFVGFRYLDLVFGGREITE